MISQNEIDGSLDHPLDRREVKDELTSDGDVTRQENASWVASDQRLGERDQALVVVAQVVKMRIGAPRELCHVTIIHHIGAVFSAQRGM
jgi:hypothetical protein